MSAVVVIRPVRSRADLSRFIDFPYTLHRNDPMWVPPLRMDVKKILSREKNPFFQHAEAEYLVAERDREVVGRIAAIHNRTHNEFHEDSVGFFGFFESINDQDVVNKLFDATAEWLRSRNLTTMRGPVSPSTNDECGLLVDGFDTPPTLLNPHTPAHYVDLVEGAGFVTAKNLLQFQSVDDTLPSELVDRVKRVAERQKITIRHLNMKQFDAEVARIKEVYNSAWEKNWGFVPMSDAELDHMANDMKPVVVPELVLFAEREGEVIGFAAALPDFNVALKKNPSGRIFPGIFKILAHRKNIQRLRILLLGLKPEYRRTGADVLMYNWIWEKGAALGFTWGEAGWILEDNTAMCNAITKLGFVHYKTLRIYDRAL